MFSVCCVWRCWFYKAKAKVVHCSDLISLQSLKPSSLLHRCLRAQGSIGSPYKTCRNDRLHAHRCTGPSCGWWDHFHCSPSISTSHCHGCSLDTWHVLCCPSKSGKSWTLPDRVRTSRLQLPSCPCGCSTNPVSVNKKTPNQCSASGHPVRASLISVKCVVILPCIADMMNYVSKSKIFFILTNEALLEKEFFPAIWKRCGIYIKNVFD